MRLHWVNFWNDDSDTLLFYQDQLVRTSFLEILQEIKKTRQLEVSCGRVKDHDENPLGNDERSLLEEDPVLILMEFGKLMGFRLIDLFAGKNNIKCTFTK